MLANIIVHGVYRNLAEVEETVAALKLDGFETANISVVVADHKEFEAANSGASHFCSG